MVYLPALRRGVAEWLKALAWKVCLWETVTRVRIPLPPPVPVSVRYELSPIFRIAHRSSWDYAPVQPNRSSEPLLVSYTPLLIPSQVSVVTILTPQRNIVVFGFDSAWTDNPRKPGALCSVAFDERGESVFAEPRLVNFDGAREAITATRCGYPLSIVAIDQPTIVPNLTGSRPVDKVAASLVSYVGGGVQPANRSKIGMFCDKAPIWSFLHKLGAAQFPLDARTASAGHFIMEVFPALALPSLDPRFAGRNCAPKYNPANWSKFCLHDWRAVTDLVGQTAERVGVKGISDWAVGMGKLARPKKADQDKLDSVLCALIGLLWRSDFPEASAMFGDFERGYMITPVSSDTRLRLECAAAKHSVSRSA